MSGQLETTSMPQANNRRPTILAAHRDLEAGDKRLVNRLIRDLHEKSLAPAQKDAVARAIRRSRRAEDTPGRNKVKFTNGYLLFYKLKYADIAKANSDQPITVIGKRMGAAWKALSEQEREKYRQKAADLRATGST